MAYRSEARTGTASGVSDAISELNTLGEECREVVDNAGENLSQTSRIQTLGEAADALEMLDEPTVPDCIEDLEVPYTESVPRRKRQAPSRAVRRDNAVAFLQATAEAAQAWLDEEDRTESDADEVTQFIEELESAISDAEGCEFPGMFG